MEKQDITLTLVPGNNGKSTWDMTYKGAKFGSGQYPIIDLKHDSGSHEFTFTIANPGSITFKSGTGSDGPIYIQETMNKPTPGVVNAQIELITLKDNNTTLTFKDKNHGAQKTLSYQLNFNNAPPLDPIIQNGGGGGPGTGYYSEYAAYAVGAVLFAVVAILLIRRFWK